MSPTLNSLSQLILSWLFLCYFALNCNFSRTSDVAKPNFAVRRLGHCRLLSYSVLNKQATHYALNTYYSDRLVWCSLERHLLKVYTLLPSNLLGIRIILWHHSITLHKIMEIMEFLTCKKKTIVTHNFIFKPNDKTLVSQ